MAPTFQDLPPDQTLGSDVLKRGVGLSAMDRELIRLLQADGRMPYVDLARAVGVPEKTVRTRVRELRDAGIIHITTVSNPEMLGYATAAFLFITCEGRSPSEVAAEAALIEAVDYVMVTTGRFDVMVEVFCSSLTDLRETVDTSVRAINGVARVEVLPFLNVALQQGAFQIGGGSRPRPLTPSVEAPAEVDRDIVAQLSADGRMSLRAVADRVGVSEAQVRRRLNRMRDAGAVAVMAITNPMSLGFDTIAILGIRITKDASSTDVAERLAGLGQVTYIAICAGRYDLFVEVVCFTAAELRALLDEQVRPLEGVAELEPFLYIGLHYKPLRPASGAAARTLFAF